MEVLIALLISLGMLTGDDPSQNSDSYILSVFEKNSKTILAKDLTDEQSSEITRIWDWGEEG